MSPARATKRVRFAHDVTDGPAAPPSERFSGIIQQLSSDLGPLALEDEGPVKGTDPGRAAAQRAQHRKELIDTGEEETSILDDVAAAEEDYEEPDELFNEAGVPIEPFHLKKEREEGYFDADGNYIEYRLDGLSDAWLDSLQESAQAAATRASAAGQSLARDADELDEDDVRSYKQRIVAILQPGETVLQGLRRLGGTQHAEQAKRASWKRERNRQPKQQRDSQGDVSMHHAAERAVGRAVPEENRETFNKLTEYASLLLDNGDYNIYSNTQEEILASVTPQQQAQPAADPEQDMFSDAPLPSATTPADRAAAPASATPTEDAAGMAAAAEQSAQPMEVGNALRSTAQAESGGANGAQGPQEAAGHGARAQAGVTSDVSTGQRGTGQATVAVGQDQSASAGVADAASAAPKASGFQFDAASGYWYNTVQGCYFDPATQLYGDASSGHWYMAKEGGQYELVS